MAIKTFLLLCFSIMLSPGLLPAQSKDIFIQIDTIVTYNEFETSLDFSINITNQGFGNFGEKFDSATIDFNNFPNYKTKIQIKSDSSVIELPIDLNGSKVLVKVFKNLDSVRINKLVIFKSQTPDSSYIQISKYKRTKDQLVIKPLKVKNIATVRKAKSPPSKIDLIINGQRYSCNLQLKKNPYPLITHAHTKKNYRKDGSQRRNDKYNYLLIRTISYYWEGEIILK